jgi:arylsulfatase A-like enzyme
VAVDVTLAAVDGYKLARPLWPMPAWADAMRSIGFEVVVIGACVAVVHAALWLLQGVSRRAARLSPTTWAGVLLAALTPIAAWWVVADRGAGWLLLAALVVVTAAAFERFRRLPEPRVLSSLLALAAAVAASAGALLVPALELARIEPSYVEERQQSSSEAPNLLLIVLDTVRADHLGAYGYGRETTPFLDALASRATRYRHAVAASSYTLPSHATLFTGLYPESHGAIIDAEGVSLESALGLSDAARVAPLSPEATTLAELAREAGLDTAAVGANLAYLSPAFGVDQGFETYFVPSQRWSSREPAGIGIGRKLAGMLPSRASAWYRSRVTGNGRFYLLASEVNAAALRWLESRRDDRFFLFLNYMDAHAPYLPPPGYRDAFPHSDAPQPRLDAFRFADSAGLAPDARAALVDAYDAELRYLDDHLLLLFERLQAWDLLDRTLVVIVGDHGESFGEHGELEHATGLHEPQLHVPLLVVSPGQTAGAVVDRTVHLADVLPTVALRLGLRTPSDLDGTPLGERNRRLPVAARLGPYGGTPTLNAFYRHPYKLIIGGDGRVELYDLVSDPTESRDLSATKPEVLEELRMAYDRFERRVRPRFRADPAVLDPATRERLRELGYGF